MKKGFTLAEVLIALGVIGVVASMTMPSLINNQKKKVLESQFKVATSLVSQAVNQMGVDNIDLSSYYCGVNRTDKEQNIFIQDFAKYFKVTKNEFGDTLNLKSIGYQNSGFLQSARGNYGFNPDSHDDGAIILANGMMIASSGCWWNGTLIDFIIDVNGNKKPNKFGYDVFYFQIGKDNKLYPSSGNYTYAETDAQQFACCNFEQANTCAMPSDTGVSCAQYAMRNIYPNDTTKTYWESLP